MGRPSLGSTKKLLLSAVPGFFGIMGLGQFFEKRTKRGLFFLLVGGALSILSSWYTIVPERIYSLVTGTAALPPYALSWMSLFTGYSASLGEALVMFLVFIPAMWGLQIYDAFSPIRVPSQTKTRGVSLPAIPSVSLPAIPSTANIPHTMSHEEVEMSIRKLANDLQKERSLLSYLWER
jgi:hypothetical protein